MNQKLAWSTFVGGLVTLLTMLAEFFSQHNSWSEMGTPKEIAHLLIIGASFCVTVFGALGANLPRERNTRVEDLTPEQLNRIKEQENKKDDILK